MRTARLNTHPPPPLAPNHGGKPYFAKEGTGGWVTLTWCMQSPEPTSLKHLGGHWSPAPPVSVGRNLGRPPTSHRARRGGGVSAAPSHASPALHSDPLASTTASLPDHLYGAWVPCTGSGLHWPRPLSWVPSGHSPPAFIPGLSFLILGPPRGPFSVPK